MTTQGPSGNKAEVSTGRPVHGGVKPSQLRALGLRPEDVLDFSASVSPIGAPDGVWDAMRRAASAVSQLKFGLEVASKLDIVAPACRQAPVYSP